MNLFFHNLSPHLIIIFICSLSVSVFVMSSPSSSSSYLRRYKSSRINDHTWLRERFSADDDDFTPTLSGWQLFCSPIREETVLLWFEGKTLKSVGLIWLFGAGHVDTPSCSSPPRGRAALVQSLWIKSDPNWLLEPVLSTLWWPVSLSLCLRLRDYQI